MLIARSLVWGNNVLNVSNAGLARPSSAFSQLRLSTVMDSNGLAGYSVGFGILG